MAHHLHQGAARLGSNLLRQRLPFLLEFHEPDLDQLVLFQGVIHAGNQGRGNPVPAHFQNGFNQLRAPFQAAFFGWSKGWRLQGDREFATGTPPISTRKSEIHPAGTCGFGHTAPLVKNMSWIKVEHALPEKTEVFRMAEQLGKDPDTVVGKLVRFWCWADRNTVDGNLVGLTEAYIDRIVHQPGFAAALRKVGWLLVRSGALVIPRFDRHNGQTAKARALAARRQAAYRERHAAVTPEASTTALPEERREETKPKIEKFTPPAREEVLAFAAQHRIPADCAHSFWLEMEGCGWLDSKGRPLRRWEPVLERSALHWQSRPSGSLPAAPSGTTPGGERTSRRRGKTGKRPSMLFAPGEEPEGVTINDWGDAS